MSGIVAFLKVLFFAVCLCILAYLAWTRWIKKSDNDTDFEDREN